MKKYRKLINNLSKETELLESLDWEKDHLKSLYEYLDIHFCGDSIITPDILLADIEQHFGKACAEILRKMFIEVSLQNGLHIYDPNVEN
jgi:hypothetical protein